MTKRKLQLLALSLCSVLALGSLAACNVNENHASDLPTNNESTMPELNPPIQAPMPEPEPPTEAPMPEVKPAPEPVVNKAKYIKIQTDGLNVRSKASTSATVLGQVDSDVSMQYLGTANGFYKTYYKNQIAYVSAKSSYTKLFEMEEDEGYIEDIIEEGAKLIGTLYVYGAVRYHNGTGVKLSGFTVKKFDCSSLMQYIFYMGNGTLLQVNTRTQIYQGESVQKSQLKRGDLMFFTNDSRRNKTGVERVGHVALYLGDNLILHTASDYCKIEQISAKRWKDFLEAKRMPKA